MAHKISLALGGGGFKGFAHIGVIRQLLRDGFEISAMAGTSAGGLVGALFAYGYSPDEIESFIDELDQRNIFNHRSSDNPSILGLGGIYDLLEDKFGTHHFHELKIPFACTAVDLKSGREVILDSGKLIDAVLATIAVPGIFPSKLLGDLHLVDGGVLDPVPVSIARWLAPNHPVIAICLSPQPELWDNLPSFKVPPYTSVPGALMDRLFDLRIGRAMRVFIDSIDIMSNMVAELRLKLEKPDFLLRPRLEQYAIFDDVKAEKLINIGTQVVKENRKEIRKIFSTHQRISRWLRPVKIPGILLSEVLNENNSSSLENCE